MNYRMYFEQTIIVSGSFFLLIVWMTTANIQTEKQRKLCLGTNHRLARRRDIQNHYQKLRERYTNCTYVEGNLELSWLDEKSDLTFLHDIREVTGYVLLSHMKLKKMALPNLMIIRGRNLLVLNGLFKKKPFALFVGYSSIESLELPALRDILTGNVGFLHSYEICFIHTINWNEILTGQGSKAIFKYTTKPSDKKCPPCDESCTGGCWGEGAKNCQKFSKINCSPQCYKGRCYGPNPRECCHLFCAGGCTGPKQSDCLACRNFHDDNVCKQECPPMKRYNPSTYSWENNPKGKYAYGATCVKNCPEHLLKDNGACVRSCPPNKKTVKGECVPCDGPCPKSCTGVKTLHSGNIEKFRNCTVIKGSITILESTFTNYTDFEEDLSGKVYPALHPSQLEVFSTLKEITGYLSIEASNPHFKNLHCFHNLEVIGGRQTTEQYVSLYVLKTSLETLGLKSLKRITSGNVMILENHKLCLTETIKWDNIMMYNSNKAFLRDNAEKEYCKDRGLVCHNQCKNEECWGPRPDECVSCQAYKLGDICMENCSVVESSYDAGNNTCKHCHSECLIGCSGPESNNCKKCQNVKDGPYCISKCPITKYSDDNKECKLCHENCIYGCTGPNNTLGPGGCNSCEKAIMKENSYSEVECLSVDATCPEGYFTEYIGPLDTDLKELVGKPVFRPCHSQCLTCTGYGVHKSVCNCKDYMSGEQCESSCPIDHYANNASRTCVKCANECRECMGPTTRDCKDCRNFRVYMNDNKTSFNCTAICPPDKPYRILQKIPYCSTVDPSNFKEENNKRVILGVTIGPSLVFFILVAGIMYWILQRIHTKKNTVKIVEKFTELNNESEPVIPSNVMPNLAQLRLIKEAELHRGGILGIGAFGTVYKGFWIPQGENVKIPVAIKVLNDDNSGTGPSNNNAFLEEAKIMASVDHPNVLKLLAVCVASQVMLVTQLMPLGCLLNYVQYNKKKIGSKPLLNWCAQIARGMAYLEKKRMVHRDLALRNVLLHNPGCIKITDFGLAKLLDVNEESYKAEGGKMPLKWLALECIQHRIFTHKSDVWAFGVTVWELFSYGEKPYEHLKARDVPDLLEKGERLPQPAICTIDVYMIMIKCWILDAESRPSFKELTDEFSKMARDPGRYLVVPGDKLMRLPAYTRQDEKDLIHTLSMIKEGPEVIMDAEEYLQPKTNLSNVSDWSPPLTPIEKFMFDCGFESYSCSPNMTSQFDFSEQLPSSSYKYCTQHGTRCRCYSMDPLQEEMNCDEVDEANHKSTTLPRGFKKRKPDCLRLSVDEEDYLLPSPLATNQLPNYMDLIEDSQRPPSYSSCITSSCQNIQQNGLDNLEYLLLNSNHDNSETDLPSENNISRSTNEQELNPAMFECKQEILPLNQRNKESAL
ncbi:epidermal growth factor receptor-like isoform X2 [Tachypleus tridentatus]|uniref:epidermal growth factor receptor-like isoform X2 n=1 Tax=Tachypleus tridentatus TaxID=6853 RepID=UPI003FCFB14C